MLILMRRNRVSRRLKPSSISSFWRSPVTVATLARAIGVARSDVEQGASVMGRKRSEAQIHDLNAQRLATIEAASRQVTEVGARLIARLMEIRVLSGAVARNDMPEPVRDAVIKALGTVAKHTEIEV